MDNTMEEIIRLSIKEKMTEKEYEKFLKSRANNCLMSMLLFYEYEE